MMARRVRLRRKTTVFSVAPPATLPLVDAESESDIDANAPMEIQDQDLLSVLRALGEEGIGLHYVFHHETCVRANVTFSCLWPIKSDSMFANDSNYQPHF